VLGYFQSSLRDWVDGYHLPGGKQEFPIVPTGLGRMSLSSLSPALEVLGYFQSSLRDWVGFSAGYPSTSIAGLLSITSIQ